ncbi:MAG: hypothetical protein JKY27_03610, partial [Magnetovibrio sp.]|nr:hypothetical protein [Magnetovibrio sp.]
RKLNNALGYSGQIVSKMRRDGVLPSSDRILLLADMIGMDHTEALTWLSYWEAKKRKQDVVAGIWETALKAMHKSSKGPAVIALLLLTLLAAPDARARTLGEQITTQSNQTIHYAISVVFLIATFR